MSSCLRVLLCSWEEMGNNTKWSSKIFRCSMVTSTAEKTVRKGCGQFWGRWPAWASEESSSQDLKKMKEQALPDKKQGIRPPGGGNPRAKHPWNTRRTATSWQWDEQGERRKRWSQRSRRVRAEEAGRPGVSLPQQSKWEVLVMYALGIRPVMAMFMHILSCHLNAWHNTVKIPEITFFILHFYLKI